MGDRVLPDTAGYKAQTTFDQSEIAAINDGQPANRVHTTVAVQPNTAALHVDVIEPTKALGANGVMLSVDGSAGVSDFGPRPTQLDRVAVEGSLVKRLKDQGQATKLVTYGIRAVGSNESGENAASAQVVGRIALAPPWGGSGHADLGLSLGGGNQGVDAIGELRIVGDKMQFNLRGGRELGQTRLDAEASYLLGALSSDTLKLYTDSALQMRDGTTRTMGGLRTTIINSGKHSTGFTPDPLFFLDGHHHQVDLSARGIWNADGNVNPDGFEITLAFSF